MNDKAIAALFAVVICQGVSADPIKKCVINGKIVYSDNLCKTQGSDIDLLNAAPPAMADKQTAEMRNAKARREEELKAAEKARIRVRDANCEIPARNVASMYDLAKMHPENPQLMKQAVAAEERLKLQCPNHMIVYR